MDMVNWRKVLKHATLGHVKNILFGEYFAIVVYYVVDLSPIEHVTTNIKILFGVIAPRMTNMLMGI
jgi:hypothetical protein